MKTFNEEPTLRLYQRTPEEFQDIFKFCKVYRVRFVEADGVTVHLSRLYLLKDGKTLRTMKTVDRRRMLGLDRGFRMKADDLIYTSDDGTTSILRLPEGS